MISRLDFNGPYQFRCAAELAQSVLEVSARRLFKGPRLPGWNWFVEVVTRMLQKQVASALDFRDIQEARCYLDSMLISSPALAGINIRQIEHEKFRGSWFSRKNAESPVTLLYFHGGGYSFYPRSYANFIAQITLAAKSRTFALDYRLTPEHRFPSQLNDALSAYQWLLDNGADPKRLVIAGDSAGGNLCLALLLAARSAGLRLPALAVALSPPTDFQTERIGNDQFDWINKRALLQWRDWFCDPEQRCDPLVSPVQADLRGLPPVYIQAGRGEALFETIEDFASYAKRQGADATLESWEDMNHNFQVFGPDAPQSVEALNRISEVIAQRVGSRKNEERVAC
ncbi:MAG TPA: alpha/beta hydrolase fold domain-containing protein [Terriglobales bacterium]|nr:alpha/beta hydrolase fold domain-containing protein [Terriglobales bacterium]